ncbi:MAG: portal protein [Endomicrobia bacterium]|nr:portal protein [Endomicrobiia bacterium]
MEDIKLKSYILAKFNESNNVKRGMDRRWYESLLFTYGRQWLSWNERDQIFEQSTAPSYKRRSRVTANRIFSTIRAVVVKLSPNIMSFKVVPKKDKVIAEVCDKILHNVLYKHRNMQYEIAFDVLVFGKSFVKVVFNPDIGEYIAEGVRLGDITLSHLTPFEVWIDPLATSIYDARYCFVVKIRDVDYVKEQYGVEVKPSSSVIPNILQILEVYYGKKPYLPKNAVVIKEFWCKSTKDYPNGLYCVLANDEVIKVEDNPYKDLEGKPFLPLVEFNFFVTNNQLYGTSLVEQLIPLQKEYNVLRTEIVLQEQLMTKPKWLIPVQCQIGENSITGEPGEKIYYDARGGVPQQIQGVPPSPEYWQHLSFIKQEFDDLAGLHDVSRGKVPSGVRSYIAIAFLQEQDQSLLAITRQNMIDGYIKMCYMILSISKQYYLEDRLLSIVGENGISEVYKFVRGSLDNLSADSIEIIEGATLPQSMVARQQFILSLWQAGLIQNPQKALELMQLPSVEIIEDTKLDERNAENENMVIQQGEYIEVSRSDNHQVHLQKHYNFMKTAEYKNLPQEVKQTFEQHCDIHQKLINLQMMALQQMVSEQQKRGKKTRQFPQ